LQEHDQDEKGSNQRNKYDEERKHTSGVRCERKSVREDQGSIRSVPGGSAVRFAKEPDLVSIAFYNERRRKSFTNPPAQPGPPLTPRADGRRHTKGP
jgi:hypothetical protein